MCRHRVGRALAGAIAAVLVLAGCGSHSEKPAGSGASSGGTETLKVGYLTGVSGAGIVAVANQQDLWKHAGLSVKPVGFVDGPTELQAMAGGDVDIAYIGPGALWLPASGQGTLITLDSAADTSDVVIGGPKVKTLADLKGKRVGVPRGTSGEMMLELALQRAKLTDADIDKVYLDPASIVTAFAGGQIDAAGIFEPFASQVTQRVKDATRLVDGSSFAPAVALPAVWVASPRLMKSNPDAVQKFLTVFAKANDYRKHHLDEVAGWTADMVHAPKAALQAQADGAKFWTTHEIVELQGDGAVGHWVETLEQLFKRFGKLKTVTPVDRFYRDAALAKAVGAN